MVNVDNINLENLSVADLSALEERIKAAKLVPTGIRAIGLIAAMKAAVAGIREIDENILGEVLGPIAPQAMPKEATTARRYNLSETQVKNAKDKAIKAIAAL
ncbi:MAG: hypothetical protein E5V63_30025 [Mesorhizobium sp.]|nr:MAG: hypothetical protein E5V63_30025 [Mesorhizobium sp.]